MKKRKLNPKEQPAPARQKRKHVEFSAELGIKICEAVALRQPLAEVCEQPGMPAEKTVYRWRRDHPEFAQAYEEARKWRAEARVDFIDGIAQRLEAGKIDPQTARTPFDIEKWQASKESPGRYSETTKTEVTGRDGAPLIASEPAEIETARRIAMILGVAMGRLQDRKLIEGEPNE